MSSVFRANVPQVYVDLNRSAAMTKEVELNDIFQTLQVYLGSVYVNDFNLFGRTWQVIVQCDSKFRDQVEDIQRLKIRNLSGQMVPLGSLAEVRETPGPFVLTRYNMYPAAFINGAAAPGTSSRQALDLMDKLAEGYLPPSMATEWTEMAYLELAAGNTAMFVFGFAVVMVFLVLAAQYESWSLAAGGDPGRADVPLERDRRCLDRQHGYQHLHPDRLRGAGGAGEQECDLDRRVCQGPSPEGPAVARGDAGGLPAAAATDRDDIDGLHPGRGAALALDGRRRRDAADAGHGRFQRHARRDRVRDLPDARVFLRGRLAGRDAAVRLGTAAQGQRPRAGSFEPEGSPECDRRQGRVRPSGPRPRCTSPAS